MKKDAYYFPHFSNARTDRKIRRVIKDLGIEGYGIYFMTLEVLREQTNFRYPYSDVDLLAEEFKTSEAKLQAVINSYDLFEIDQENNFFSPKMILYLQPYIEKSNRARLAAQKRWNSIKSNANAYANALPEYCKSESKSNASQNASKVKESKVKNNNYSGAETDSKNCFIFYEKNGFGMMTPFVSEDIGHFLNNGIEHNLIIKCLQISLENNVKKWSYAKSILNDCLDKKIKTVNDFEATKKAKSEIKNEARNQESNKYDLNKFDEKGNFTGWR